MTVHLRGRCRRCGRVCARGKRRCRRHPLGRRPVNVEALCAYQDRLRTHGRWRGPAAAADRH